MSENEPVTLNATSILWELTEDLANRTEERLKLALQRAFVRAAHDAFEEFLAEGDGE
jgi:hypothetical protein